MQLKTDGALDLLDAGGLLSRVMVKDWGRDALAGRLYRLACMDGAFGEIRMAKIHKVGIAMGSDSDWPTMKETVEALKWFGIQYDVDVISAHRTPELAMKYAKEAEKKGYCAIIAGSGGAAHLAGVMAALTPLPVIGVPMQTSSLNGQDSLYSIVQMPGGVPVATMAIGKAGAKNAGILAAQIIGVGDPAMREKVKAYKRKLAAEVKEKVAKLRQEMGNEKSGQS